LSTISLGLPELGQSSRFVPKRTIASEPFPTLPCAFCAESDDHLFMGPTLEEIGHEAVGENQALIVTTLRSMPL